jgi:hypothetical protein
MKTERVVQVLVLIVTAGMAGAASFTHVHDWTMDNAPAGTGSWFGWANAVISELTPIAAGIEIRRRKRVNKPVAYPMAILIAAALLSLTAQVSQARPTLSGWISSAVPALAVLALVKLVLSSPADTPAPDTSDTGQHPGTDTDTREPADTTGVVHQVHDLEPVPSGQLLIAARMAAFRHQQDTGQPITTGELADRMDIPPALADSLIDHLSGETPPPVTTANGTAPGSRS